MVHAHGRQHRRLRRIDDIGGIQRAAQAHFQHGNVALFPPEVQQSNGSDQLKLRGVVLHGLGGRADLLCQSRQGVLRDHLAIDLDPLPEVLQVGRGIQAHPVARGLQNGGQHGAGTALSIGTGHMDEFHPPLRVSQGAEQRPDALQARCVALPLKAVNVGDGLLTGHEHPPLSAGGIPAGH